MIKTQTSVTNVVELDTADKIENQSSAMLGNKETQT